MLQPGGVGVGQLAGLQLGGGVKVGVTQLGVLHCVGDGVIHTPPLQPGVADGVLGGQLAGLQPGVGVAVAGGIGVGVAGGRGVGVDVAHAPALQPGVGVAEGQLAG